MVKIFEEENKNLYYDLEECLNFCKTIDNDNKINEVVNFHVFWNVGLPFERKQLLGIKSYLCTQDLEKTKFNPSPVYKNKIDKTVKLPNLNYVNIYKLILDN
jgi:hypothetical protein